MKKYYIGLLVIAIITFGVTIYEVIAAAPIRQDLKTYNAATNIADKLNNYVNNNGVIPQTLSEAGVKNVPSTITYAESNDASSYKFCVDYKANSSPYSSTNISGVVSGAVTQSLTGAPLSNQPDQSGDQSSLYIDPTYEKGLNCQTITPYISTFSPGVYNLN